MEEAHFQEVLTNSRSKVVTMNFLASRNYSCHQIAPAFEELSRHYQNVLFFNVEQCQETATNQGVASLPTFIFYRKKAKLRQVKGPDIQLLNQN